MIDTRLSMEARRLPDGTTMDLGLHGALPAPDKGLMVALGGGRGCQLRTDSAIAAAWIPLRGRLQVTQGREGPSSRHSSLAAGEVLVSEGESTQAVGRGNALWMVLLGRPAVWRQFLHDRLGVPLADAWLLPARHPAHFDLRRATVSLARAVASRETPETVADNVIERIMELQAGFSGAIARCPGRTYAQRRQVFVRLQRVRNYLSERCSAEVDNDELARMANYSPTHFIHAFRSVFGDTPHAYLVRQRLECARRLLRGSPLAINEIAMESGFENPSVFARVFRQRFGMTAGSMRRQYESANTAVG